MWVSEYSGRTHQLYKKSKNKFKEGYKNNNKVAVKGPGHSGVAAIAVLAALCL